MAEKGKLAHICFEADMSGLAEHGLGVACLSILLGQDGHTVIVIEVHIVEMNSVESLFIDSVAK